MASAPSKRSGSIPELVVLKRISYKDYCRLRRNPANRHVRMTYNDGTLELVSPIKYEHEKPSGRLRSLIMTLTSELGIVCEGTGSSTFKRSGEGPYRGKGREPDQSFFFKDAGKILEKSAIGLDEGDPPPDLWIEVDNRASSRGRLPVYAGLGVPEVWRYRARRRTLAFLRLVDGAYLPVERSLALPMLTPELVLEALALGDRLAESIWINKIREWTREKFGPRPAAD